MPPATSISSPETGLQAKVLHWILLVFLVPLGVFVGIALWQYRAVPEVQPVNDVSAWIETLADNAASPEHLQDLALQAPDFTTARWEPAVLPKAAMEPGAESDQHAIHERLWLRVRIPEALATQAAREGRLGLLINRIVGAGPWSVWAGGKLLQTDRNDWRMQWNTPMLVMLPVSAREVFIGLPYLPSAGYAIGSMFIGPADDINLAWQTRILWMTDTPRAASIVALLLVIMTLPMALQRKREPAYALLCANALVWCLTNLQYFHDFTGHPNLSRWFGVVMDVSINWNIVLTLLFAFELQERRLRWLQNTLLAYASLSTLLSVALMAVGKYSLFANHYGNIAAFIVGLAVYTRHLAKTPNREGVILLLAMLAPLFTGLHSLLYVSSNSHPDHVHTFPFAVLGTFFAFFYAISRRSAQAIHISEMHQSELQRQLAEQRKELEKQHRQIADLELEHQLSAQREEMLQDLHDGLGSNLTSALFQARNGKLTRDETLLLLQDLAEELRLLSRTSTATSLGVNDILAELRQRIQKRLTQGGITLEWKVATNLPRLDQLPAGAGQHLRAMLSEAIANVLRHAGATRIEVFAECSADSLNIEITDNGRGFEPDEKSPGRGLPGARHRAELLGCRFGFEPAADGGSRFWISMPIANNAA